MSIAIMKRTVPGVFLFLALATQIGARIAPEEDQPRTPSTASAAFSYNTATHRIGKLALACTNHGTYGSNFAQSPLDLFTGTAAISCEYPIGSGTQYTYGGAFWIGAVRGRDTLVSVGHDGWQNAREIAPLEEEFGGKMIRRSIIDPSSPEFEDALSQEDFLAKYADTASNLKAIDFGDARPHRPLGIEVAERSFAWSYEYAEDFVLFDYAIKNNSARRLNAVYMGIYCDADVGGISEQNNYTDDICGFLDSIPSPKISSHDCEGKFYDVVKSAWIADNDGDFSKDIPVPHVTATRVVRTPAESLKVSFNWWISGSQDFGPMGGTKTRDLGTGGLGTPEGDRNKYFYLSNGEYDYDQIYTWENSTPGDPDFEFWLPAPATAAPAISRGVDTRYLLSFGPFDLDAGQTVPISFCYVGGKNLHKVQNNFDQYMKSPAYNPHEYYANLDFKDLGLNSMWAGWLYDNPGFDSDNDGYAGKYRICTTGVKYDTIYYEGDGVPDFRGAAPPEAPKVWLVSPDVGLQPEDGKLNIRFNGQRSENTKDPFSQVKDFEGYRVYLGLDERSSSISVVTSYDFDNYNKYTLVTDTLGNSSWELIDLPMSRELIDSLYGFPQWNPLTYTEVRPWRNPLSLPQYVDSFFYFTNQDYNNSRLGFDTKIVKWYPDASLPPEQYFHLIPDSVLRKYSDSSFFAQYYTPDGWMKYYEYRLTIDNLLPTVPYYVNVTAFDFGAPSIGLGALETSPIVGLKVAFPQGPAPVGNEWVDKVYVYPNPYRIDGLYQDEGFEGRERDLRRKAPDRKRKINFANLPDSCTIQIYTLDGDLVKEIKHRVTTDDPLYSHESWDMITRNTQLVVSGLYYWTVEDERGNVQIGKLVIIM